jgi:hypothetical protein
VPRYRFHHVEIKKNVLTPNTMLTFVPHLRDLESNEETKYNRWLKELVEIDLKSGFKPMNREDKVVLTTQTERAATVSLYLEDWLQRLAIPHCSKSALIASMALEERDDAMTPQQKTDLLLSHRENSSDIISPEARRAAKIFMDGFKKAFHEDLPRIRRVDLRKILLLDEFVDSILEPKQTTKETSSIHLGDEDEVAESNLATYTILGCLICFSHSCDHGEYDIKNWKRTFSISSSTPMSQLLKSRRQRRLTDSPNHAIAQPCKKDCYKAEPATEQSPSRTWTEDDTIVLRSLLVAGSHSTLRQDPICIAAKFLGRNCKDVYAKLQTLNIRLLSAVPTDPPRVKTLSWYDRRKKMLLGDWQDHTVTHEHQRREIIEPCSHNGPCAPRICSCVDAGILCEKWCNCTAETCAYKFTGCACHSLGMTCQSKQKERPCICIQLNRECDPELCLSCGAAERADPQNAEEQWLHATGCQNCDLQRGVTKPLMLGQSQLEGVGYGLFTAEDIAQDDFVIEYVGELITHDEGVRREARRGDVFDEDSNISYVFTLLENEGIWVDAAIYGNLSRYINHASEHDRRGCNITPRILYVNGEYRIKFTAIRDIEAGEELFFNYGENFPNLTKKLLDTKAEEKPEVTRNKSDRPRQMQSSDKEARNASKLEQKKTGKKKSRARASAAETAEAEAGSWDTTAAANPRKRKRDVEDDSAEDDYHPSKTDEVGTESGPYGEVTFDVSHSESIQKKAQLGLRARRASDTPTKRNDRPKARGKRGGARAGSGRPRKHPRPTPKSTTEQAASSVQQSPSASFHTTTSPDIMTGSPRANWRGRGTMGRENVSVIQDSQDESANDADEDDEDVMLRKGVGRAARNRRPPAKFRDDDV